MIAFLGAWILFKTQLDNFEGMVRAVTDILWTGSDRVRAWRGGDVRAVYYTVLAILVVWGIIALRLAQPIVLLKIGANVAGLIEDGDTIQIGIGKVPTAVLGALREILRQEITGGCCIPSQIIGLALEVAQVRHAPRRPEAIHTAAG